MVDLDYLKKSPWQKFWFRFAAFFKALPKKLAAFFKAIPQKLKKLWLAFIGIFVNIGKAAKDGDWKTRTSFLLMGFGLIARKQYLRGILYMLFEVLFVLYMVFFGWKYLAKMGSLGEVAKVEVWDDALGAYTYKFYDNSLLILLYSLLTIFIMAGFLYGWYQNVKGNLLSQQFVEAHRALPTSKDDLRSCADKNYHKTLLSVPMLGLVVFTVLPIFFMVFIAFTNYDKAHLPPNELFRWNGVDNFVTLFGGGVSADSKAFAYTFGEVLLWTIVWAVFATFTNYILGMIVAILINKKGVKFKKVWRTILVMTIAVPQFVSLMFMSQLLADQGLINNLLMKWGWIDHAIPFLTDGTVAKVTIIVVNMWIGIPYSMLICTGILMNIPADLYESARMDGSGPIRAYMKITLPYMLHVTTPYLITQFIGNLNNFNVIFLLTGGNPSSLDMQFAGKTDLLITWLYKLTVSESQYGIASVIGIVTFVIVAVFSLILYNRSKSVKNEEDFM
ncbi:MAG: sugar ABC transporter permease [Clostridiales bacterium]|nr:sugar ABC transporter permease [Clostridiales bacterium]